MSQRIYRADLAREANILGERIAAARKERGWSQGELARHLAACGVRMQTPAVHKWESGATVPGGYQLLALCHTLGLEEGLAYFTGPVSVPEGHLNAEGRRMLRHYQGYLESQEQYTRPMREPLTLPVRLCDLPASAGPGTWLTEGSYEWTEFPADEVPRGTDFAVRVRGDSMEPMFHDGQIVFFAQCEVLRSGEIGLFGYEEQGYIKEYREEAPGAAAAREDLDEFGVVRPRVRLVSANPAYAPIEVGGALKIFGKALGAEKACTTNRT